MVLTRLEARVPPDREWDLQIAYSEAARDSIPPGLVRSTLLRTTNDPTLWTIETLWESRDALVAMRGTGTPRGILIFRAAGVEPTFTLLEVLAVIPPSEQP
jgi:heme-degrading monooxygenase HmoA